MVAVLAGTSVLALAVRLPSLGSLPWLAAPDEMVMMSRARDVFGGSLPVDYDWPTGSPLLLAGVLRAASVVGGARLIDDSEIVLLFGRAVSAMAGIAVTLLTAVLAAQLCESRRTKRMAAILAGSAMSVAYIGVAASRLAHPEIQQDALVAACLVCTLRFDRTKSIRWMLLAAICAGLAAGFKYVGGVSFLTLAAAILTGSETIRHRLRQLGFAAAAAGTAFICVVPALMVAPGSVVLGIREQLIHSETGHPGFDTQGMALWYHLGTTVPASLGYIWTACAYGGVAAALFTRNSSWRLLGLSAVTSLMAIGVTHLTFPRYGLLPLIPLVALAGGGIARGSVWAGQASRELTLFAVLVALAALSTPLTADLRLIAAARSVRTENLASNYVDHLTGRVVAEAYTLPSTQPVTHTSSLAKYPDVLRCHCYLVLSSFVEDRFRAEPSRYGPEIAVYDVIRRLGKVRIVIRPQSPPNYRWAALPQYGINAVPLTTHHVIGPQITVLQMP
jgi:hypothetical protein